MLWLQAGHHAVSFFPLAGSYSVYEMIQGASNPEELCDSIVPIISCWSLLIWDSGKAERFQFFYKQEAGNMEILFTWGTGPHRFLLGSKYTITH